MSSLNVVEVITKGKSRNCKRQIIVGNPRDIWKHNRRLQIPAANNSNFQMSHRMVRVRPEPDKEVRYGRNDKKYWSRGTGIEKRERKQIRKNKQFFFYFMAEEPFDVMSTIERF